MFGNLIGWIISAVIVVLALLLGRGVLSISQPTAPTGWVASTVKPLGALDDAARAVLPPMNNLKDDAADLYRQASVDYDHSSVVYDSLQKERDLKEVDYTSLPGIDAVVKAGTCPSMELFKSTPAEIVGFQTDVTVLDNLQQVANAMERVVSLAKLEKQNELAEKYAQALLVLGYHLYKERAAYEELSVGESIMGATDQLLMSLYEDENANDKLTALKQFDLARITEYKDAIDPVRQVLNSPGQQTIAQYAGDFYQMAADPKVDHVWRVEAIRRIGRLHFDAENKADQLKSSKFLTRVAADPAEDPLIRAAATAAVNMTAKDNQALR